MTPLAQVALVFCRECLTIEDLRSIPPSSKNGLAFDIVTTFDYTDLKVVLPAVRRWCDQNDASLELAYYGILPGEWEARVVTSVLLETIVHSDPCQALLAASVEAARRLKRAA